MKSILVVFKNILRSFRVVPQFIFYVKIQFRILLTNLYFSIDMGNFLTQSIIKISNCRKMPRQIKKTPQCIYGNQCVLFCVNPNCKNPAFICQKGVKNRNQCGLFHENCQKMSWTELDNIIYQNPNTRTAQFSDFVEQMQNLFSSLIKKIKQQHLKFKIFIRNFCYSTQMMKFIKQVNDEDFDKITGMRLNDIIGQLFIRDEKRTNSQFIFQRHRFQKISQQIAESFNKIQPIYKRTTEDQKKVQLAKPLATFQAEVIDSKITKQFEYIKSLLPKNKIVRRIKNIYKASQNSFSVEAFHQKCDNVPNTIILIETEFGKVIGGYTSLAWNSSKKHWTTDKQLSSFIFSVSMKQRFNLNLSQFAIACNPKKGPIFGCCDICILDRADRQFCNAEFPIIYSNFKHTRCPQTNLQFIGSQLGKFRTRQWQVFQVDFVQP